MMNSTPQSVGYFSRRMSRLAAHPATMPMTMKMRMVHMTGGAPVQLRRRRARGFYRIARPRRLTR